MTRGLKYRKDSGKFVKVDELTLKSLLKLPSRDTYVGLRDYTLILLTIDTAIRPGEALKLIPEDFSLRSMEVLVRKEIAKTRISRTLPISSQTQQTLRRLLSVRHKEWKGNVPVFCSCDGKEMQINSWSRRMRNYSKQLNAKVTPYMLRHASATLFLRNNGNALALQKMLGHTSMEMTERYVHLVQEDIREQHALASPVNYLVPTIARKRKI